jgi:hypothetical protein
VAEARRSTLDPADDLELTRLEAYTYAVYDDAQRSVDAFSRLLSLQPSWALPPDTSPKIRRYFLDAKKKRRAARLLEEPLPGEAEDATPPFYASGWFWGGVLGAVAAGVGLGLWAAHREPGTPRGNLGTVELP